MNFIFPGKNRLAIFDIDGTLTDSVQIHQTAFKESLDNLALSGYDTNWGNYKHHTDSFIFKTIYESQFKKPVSTIEIGQFEHLLHESISAATKGKRIVEIGGANNFLNELLQHSDCDIVFATGSLLKPAKLKLLQADFLVPDELIVAANDILSREELVLKAIEQAKHFYSKENYEQVISFGDGRWDYETAQNTGISFVGIGNDKLPGHGVVDYFRDFKDELLFELMGIRKQISELPDFEIRSNAAISQEFIKRNILTFKGATAFIRQLPYGRNGNKNDLTSIFSDNCGTCSTKHAILKSLAAENSFKGIQLMMGIFKMNGINTPHVAATLRKYNLDFIPEAHNYLKYKNAVLDFTFIHSKPTDIINDLIEETELLPEQITDYKVIYHKKYLSDWLIANPQINYSLDELWRIREECIASLSS